MSDMSDRTPPPLLSPKADEVWVWSVVAICAVITIIQLYQLCRNNTNLRAFSLFCSLITDCCAVMNALRIYYLISEHVYIATFMFCTALYVTFSNMSFLYFGMRFYPDGRLWGEGRTLKLFILFIFGGAYLVLSLSTSVWSLAFQKVPTIYFILYCIAYGLTIIAGAAGTNYAFAPLMAARRKHETNIALEAYAVGFWFLGVGNMLTTCYGIFCIVVLSKADNYFLLPVCHGIDFLFRIFLNLTYTSTPPRIAINFLCRTLFPSSFIVGTDKVSNQDGGGGVGKLSKPKTPSVTWLQEELDEYSQDLEIGGGSIPMAPTKAVLR